MAERRMFHAGVVESDAFLDMTPGAQALYFHLGMQADDDGFVNGPRQVCRRCGARMEELQELIDGDFLLWFDGVAVLKHFRMANTLQNDRIKQFRYPEIAKQIYILPNRIYTLSPGKKKENLFSVREKSLREMRKKTKKLLESTRNPKRSKPNSTQPNSTQPNSTQPNSTQSKPIIIGSKEKVGVDDHIDPWANKVRPYDPLTTYDEEEREDVILNEVKDPHRRAVSTPEGNVGRELAPAERTFAGGGGKPPPYTLGSVTSSVSLPGESEASDVAISRENWEDRPPESPRIPQYDSENKKETVLKLSLEQMGMLYDRMGFLTAVRYMEKLRDFICAKNANIKDHYDTILKWWEEDGGTYNV